MMTAASVALDLLDAAAKAAKRLDDPRDREALHDFRVAVRRLHTHLKSYRGLLGEAAPGKVRKRLLKVFTATSPARDAEVELEWLRPREGRPSGARKAGVEWLAEDLERRRREGMAEIRGAGVARFWRAEKKLRRTLKAPARAPGGLKSAAGPLIRKEAAKLARRLHGKGSLLDPKKSHKLRINVKRLRYLIEPFGGKNKDGAPALEGLKKLQDALGRLHDGNVFAAEVAAAAEASAGRSARGLVDSSAKAAAPFWPERQGLLAVAHEIEAERARLLGDLKENWLGLGSEPVLQDVERLARSLSGRASADGKEPGPKAGSPLRRAARRQSPAGKPLPSSAQA